MIRAYTASGIAVNTPFGAAHRVYFDNPPLKGSCRYTAVYLRRSHDKSAN
jgi:hypothetical protein